MQSLKIRSGVRDNVDDYPPMSRLFIICSKAHKEEDFREAFSPFGEIEDIWVVKDKHSQENKGIAYIKYAKTSEAAKAQEEMNGKTIGKLKRSVKVLVAASRSQGSKKCENEYDKYVRLFIVVPKHATKGEIFEQFCEWGDVENVFVVRDKTTGISKGFAYVRYAKFYHAAMAFENCSAKYKAVFAEPKGSSRKRDYSGRNLESQTYGAIDSNYSKINDTSNPYTDINAFLNMQNVGMPQPTCMEITCSKSINQDQMWRLFDIIPGLDYCQIKRESGSRTNEAVVVYDNPESAIYAKKKLHGLEYPIGERIIIKISGLNSNRMDTSFDNKRTRKDSLCNVPLPPSQPLAMPDAVVEQRLFIVLSSNLPQTILKSVFSCWKGLVDVYLLPHENCGFAEFADKESAQRAMHTLNGAEICGANIKVMEAKERCESDTGDNFKKRFRKT